MVLSLALRQLCVWLQDPWAGFYTWRGAASSLQKAVRKAAQGRRQKAAKRQLKTGCNRQLLAASRQAATRQLQPAESRCELGHAGRLQDQTSAGLSCVGSWHAAGDCIV